MALSIEDITILGTPFLRAFYTIYDYENNKAGIALAKGSKGGVYNST